jgi:hypothetical protein
MEESIGAHRWGAKSGVRQLPIGRWATCTLSEYETNQVMRCAVFVKNLSVTIHQRQGSKSQAKRAANP